MFKESVTCTDSAPFGPGFRMVQFQQNLQADDPSRPVAPGPSGGHRIVVVMPEDVARNFEVGESYPLVLG
jgi:hypothetical protein